MAGLENMKKRLGHNGGDVQNNRMIKGKLETLKRAMKASYAAATAITDTGEFSCLINPNKQNETYDNKILSIPFKAPNLTNPEVGEIETGVAAGKVIEWKENNTFWLIYLPRLNEKAYFRADLKRCQYEVEIEGAVYRVATEKIQPSEITWRTKDSAYFNDLDYLLTMYITKDSHTLSCLKRFTEIKINGKNWQVQGVDSMDVENVLVVSLKEYYSNEIKEAISAEKESNKEESENSTFITGPIELYPYDRAQYSVSEEEVGEWIIDETKMKIIKKELFSIEVEITSGRKGETFLGYKLEDNEEKIKIEILSL